MNRNLRLEPTIQRIMAGGLRLLPTSNSVPNSSAAPTVTTAVPAAGPAERTARSPSMRR